MVEASEQPAARSGSRTVFVGERIGRRLGHEVHAAEDDDLCVRVGGFAREPERVADIVGDVLDLGTLVVVRENDGIARARQVPNLLVQRGVVVRFEDGHWRKPNCGRETTVVPTAVVTLRSCGRDNGGRNTCGRNTCGHVSRGQVPLSPFSRPQYLRPLQSRPQSRSCRRENGGRNTCGRTTCGHVSRGRVPLPPFSRPQYLRPLQSRPQSMSRRFTTAVSRPISHDRFTTRYASPANAAWSAESRSGSARRGIRGASGRLRR